MPIGRVEREALKVPFVAHNRVRGILDKLEGIRGDAYRKLTEVEKSAGVLDLARAEDLHEFRAGLREPMQELQRLVGDTGAPEELEIDDEQELLFLVIQHEGDAVGYICHTDDEVDAHLAEYAREAWELMYPGVQLPTGEAARIAEFFDGSMFYEQLNLASYELTLVVPGKPIPLY